MSLLVCANLSGLRLAQAEMARASCFALHDLHCSLAKTRLTAAESKRELTFGLPVVLVALALPMLSADNSRLRE